MSTATVARKQKDRVPAMRMMDVLELFVPSGLGGQKFECKLSELWGTWGTCRKCQTTIAMAADVLWGGENEAFAHAGHISREDAVPWSEVRLPGHSKSVAEKLEEKKKAKEAQAAA